MPQVLPYVIARPSLYPPTLAPVPAFPRRGRCIQQGSLTAPRPRQKFSVNAATSEANLAACRQLVHELYSSRGYLTSEVHGTDHVRPEGITLLVRNAAQEPVATLTFSPDGGTGLQADALYHDQLQPMRADGRRLIEFGRLAIKKGAGHSKHILAAMLHAGFVHCQSLGCSYAVLEVNPRHAGFYETGMGMHRIGAERTCTRVNAPAVLLRMNLHYASQQILQFGGHVALGRPGPTTNFFRYFFTPEQQNRLATSLQQGEPYSFGV